MRAVLWTDLIQFFLYLSGALIALGAILARLPGGWEQLVAMGQAAGKLRAFNPTLGLAASLVTAPSAQS